MDLKLCRLCCENEATLSIFQNDENKIQVSSKIMYCCIKLDIKEDDGLPSHICRACERQLDACYQFVLKCEASNSKLRSRVAVGNPQAIIENNIYTTKTEVKIELNSFGDDDDHSDQLDHFPFEDDSIKLESSEKHNSNKSPYKKRMKHKKVSTCSICGRICTSPSALIIHMRMHTNEKPYQCPSCDKKYKDCGALKRHVNRNHSKRERNFICESCGKGFFSKSDMKVHLRVHTGEYPYVCSICSMRFTQLSAMRRHRNRHTGEKSHVCLTCSKRFCTKQELNNHQSVHNKDKNFSCPICNSQFKQKSNANKHMKLHSEPNRFVCNHCGRTFNVKGNLKSHIDRRHSEKSGHCNVCSKSVTNIEMHMWRHTGQRPLKCEFCAKSFFELKALGHHVNFKHKKTDRFKCNVEGCSMSFPSRPMLEFHTAKIHNTQIPFPCDRCSRGFYRKNDLARHKLGTHKERLI